jgi:anti-anti-sigma factor
MMSWWRKLGLRFKAGLGLGLTLALALGGILFLTARYMYVQLWDRETRKAEEINSVLVASLENTMLENRWDKIWATVLGMQQSPTYEMEDVALFSKRPDPTTGAYTQTALAVFVTGFPGGRTIPRASMDLKEQDAGCIECHRLPPPDRPAVATVALDGQAVLRSAVAIQNKPSCRTCHSAEGSSLGVSLVDFRLDSFQQATTMSIAQLAGGGAVALLLMLAVSYLLLNRMVLQPLRSLLGSTRAIARGELDQRVPVASADEVGQLGTSFNEMTEQMATTYTELQQALHTQEEQAAALRQALAEVQQSQEEQSHLLTAIRQISTPVVPVMQGVLVVPLVGVIDSARAQGIIETLLAAIERERARVVILDITGVPMVDTAVAQALLQAAQATRLLGAEPVLVGITPPVAETIVSLGVDLAGLRTRADLQGGVAYAMQRLGARG